MLDLHQSRWKAGRRVAAALRSEAAHPESRYCWSGRAAGRGTCSFSRPRGWGGPWPFSRLVGDVGRAR
eukprot:868135-Lingulodinium_polyedra.AAC.1